MSPSGHLWSSIRFPRSKCSSTHVSLHNECWYTHTWNNSIKIMWKRKIVIVVQLSTKKGIVWRKTWFFMKWQTFCIFTVYEVYIYIYINEYMYIYLYILFIHIYMYINVYIMHIYIYDIFISDVPTYCHECGKTMTSERSKHWISAEP